MTDLIYSNDLSMKMDNMQDWLIDLFSKRNLFRPHIWYLWKSSKDVALMYVIYGKYTGLTINSVVWARKSNQHHWYVDSTDQLYYNSSSIINLNHLDPGLLMIYDSYQNIYCISIPEVM